MSHHDRTKECTMNSSQPIVAALAAAVSLSVGWYVRSPGGKKVEDDG